MSRRFIYLLALLVFMLALSTACNNITDERAIYTNNTGQFEWGAAQMAEGRAHHQTLYTARPREVGMRYMKRWGD